MNPLMRIPKPLQLTATALRFAAAMLALAVVADFAITYVHAPRGTLWPLALFTAAGAVCVALALRQARPARFPTRRAEAWTLLLTAGFLLGAEAQRRLTSPPGSLTDALEAFLGPLAPSVVEPGALAAIVALTALRSRLHTRDDHAASAAPLAA